MKTLCALMVYALALSNNIIHAQSQIKWNETVMLNDNPVVTRLGNNSSLSQNLVVMRSKYGSA